MQSTCSRHAARGSAPRLSKLALAVAAPTALLFGADLASAQALEEIVVTARFREENLQQTPLAISAISSEALAANGATDVIDVGDWAPNVVIDQLGAGWGPTVAATVRGLGYGDFKATSEPTMTIYLDDVVLGRPTGAILDLLDLERVEVLRGPQGTLFGKNAIGGVMRLISRKPGEGDDSGQLEVTTGEYSRLDVRGAFGTTLIEDKLYARVSYVSKQRDGWQDNVDYRCQMIANGTPQLAGVNDGIVGWTRDPDGPTGADPNNSIAGVGGPGAPILGAVGSVADNTFALPTRTSARGTDEGCVVDRLGDVKVQAARGSVRWIASDSFELNFSADVTDDRSKGPYDLLTAANPNTNLGVLYNSSVALPNWGVPWDARFIPTSEDVNYSGFNANTGIDGGIETPNISNVRHWGASTTLDWTLGNDIGVKLIVAHREFDAQWGRDSDASPMPINHTLDTYRNSQDTAELRVSGELFGDKTQWTAGYFWYDADDFNSNISVLYPAGSPSDPRACLLGTSCIDRVDSQTTKNTGVFLNTVTQLTEAISLTVGLRRSEDEKVVLQERFGRDGLYCCGFDPPTYVFADASSTDPMVSLSYNLNDNIMFYGTYQEGFRGGGTTARPTATTRVPFGPETLENFEVGMKSDLLDRRLRLNVTLFDMTYSDMQIGTAGQDQNGQPAWTTGNDGEASISGIELELTSAIGEHWTVGGTVGNTDFQFTRVPTLQDCLNKGFPAASCAGLIDINSSPGRTPEWKLSLDMGYAANLDNGSQVAFHYGISWQDDTYFGPNDDPLLRADAYAMHNARVTWVSASGDWEASVFGTNITDERAITSKLNFLNLFGTVETTYARPEEWGMSIKKNF
jgi:iron complex outermembrane receptor protein